MCILLLLSLCTPNLLINLSPFPRMLYIYLFMYLCIYISISCYFSICSYVFSSHPERCLLTRFRDSFFLLPRLRVCALACFRAFSSFFGLAVRTASTTYTVGHVSVSLCNSRLLFSSYVSVCSPPFFSLSFFVFLIRFVTSFPNYVVSLFVVSGPTSTSSAPTLPAATLC